MDGLLSIRESEINDFSHKVGCFETLCHRYHEGSAPEETLINELNNTESHPIDKENLFNQITAFYLIGLAYCFLKQNKLSPSTTYYSNEIIDKEIAFYRKSLQAISLVRKRNIIALKWSSCKCPNPGPHVILSIR